ncbi:MAG: hypothetical protein WC804_11125 [Sphingomonas sp.]
MITMTVVHPDAFKHFPATAKVSLVLIENKGVEIVDLGTVAKLQATQTLKTRGFVAPSCQLRIADPGIKAKGLLLASTDSWTLRGDDDPNEANSRGILQFLAADTSPQSWKLDIRDSDYPIVKVDKRIPNAASWARNDPVFVGTALPFIVRQVFDEILRGEYPEDLPWVIDWLAWAAAIMPDRAPPLDEGADKTARVSYLDALVDSFCDRHEFANKLLADATPKDPQ